METEVVEMNPFFATVHRTKPDGEPDIEHSTPVMISCQGTLQEAIDFVKKTDNDPSSEYRLWIEMESESKEKTWELVLPGQLAKTLEALELTGDVRVMVDRKEAGKEWSREYKEPQWRQDLKVGDLIDALDKMNKWYESSIRDIKDSKILIHYNGWPSKWDEWVGIDSDRVAKVHTHTTGPYQRKNSIGGGYGGGWSSMAANEEGTGLQKGIAGLRNLGNTCFMNSTLQCLTATSCMLPYWLNDTYKSELNPQNALGWQGKIAEEYGALVKEIWSGKYRIVVPRNFKQAIGEFAPRFSGYNQQDSSELLSFLLDGIHEDLNRIMKKPYTEAVESKGRPDEEVAAEAWMTHKKRHDSIIVDNFQGLLKSRVVCPSCDTVSVTFDPFMFLSVPLPTIQEKVIEIKLVPADSEKRITAYGVKVPQAGSVLDLKKSLAKQVKINFQRLIVGEVWKGKVYKFFPNSHLLGDVRPSEDIWAWEVPTMDEQKEQKENDKNAGYDVVQVMPVFVKEQTGWSVSGMLGGKSIVAEPCGVPLPLVVPENLRLTGSELNKRVAQIFDPFCIPGEKPYQVRQLDTYSSQAKDVIADDETVYELDRILIGIEILDESKLVPDRLKNYDNDESAPSKKVVGAGGGRVREAIDLSACINAYTLEETLNEQNAWFCPKCKDFKCATKKFDIWSVPKVLIVHLKRFQYSKMYRDKIDTFVDFPVEDFDLARWVIGPQKNAPLMYDLYGVSNHMGGLGGGHYTAYIKSPEDGKWYDMNDSSTSLVGGSEIKSSSAYVLFYQLRENH
eukprot:TRINITY_DN18175_c3_g1_i1.p1 TRINITY_DN18175_c3_g1~~TRINITY_DN18175_c3_g1_i1.p1  ORF type:complete len:919 (-),score=242.67 TRINITY_DN18175_c3_g1_i1:91-2454(-)